VSPSLVCINLPQLKWIQPTSHISAAPVCTLAISTATALHGATAGLPDFFRSSWQNPDKNGQNGCFLKTLWPKSQDVLTMVISIYIGVSNCSEAVHFLPKKCGFAKEASFHPKTAIFAVNLKLPVTTFLHLS